MINSSLDGRYNSKKNQLSSVGAFSISDIRDKLNKEDQ